MVGNSKVRRNTNSSDDGGDGASGSAGPKLLYSIGRKGGTKVSASAGAPGYAFVLELMMAPSKKGKSEAASDSTSHTIETHSDDGGGAAAVSGGWKYLTVRIDLNAN